jgi:fibronectin-binding autotransporter adhesin
MGGFYLRGSNSAGDLLLFSRAPQGTNQQRIFVRANAQIVAYTTVTTRVIAYGRDGRDSLNASNLTVPAEFYGEAGDDVITGSTQSDFLAGGLGHDRINGSSGDNVIWGDNAPSLSEPQPQDSVAGGNDTLSALGGSDVFYGGGGDDSVSAGAGNDYASGGQGHDTLDGSDGDDRLYGGAGSDTLGGHSGNDLLSGGDDGDKLYGSSGNDVLIGGTGSDLLDGGEGNDLLVSGSVSNENSSWTSVATTTTFPAASYSNPADSDAALLTLLTQWGAASNRTSLATITHDGVNDDLFGSTGDDDFCWEMADVLDNQPGMSPPDFMASGMGNDERFDPT